MATDPFLTKKSVVGLAERVSLTPPTIISFEIASNQAVIFDDQETDYILKNSVNNFQVLMCWCFAGGEYLGYQESFPCMAYIHSKEMFCFGACFKDDYSAATNIEIVIDLNTSTVRAHVAL